MLIFIRCLQLLIALLLVSVTTFVSCKKYHSQHDCECGIEGITSRILFGDETPEGQFPWVVYIRSDDENATHTLTRSCTGSIISDRHILTAAHCIQPGQRASDLKVYTFQGCDKSKKAEINIPLRVWRVFSHPGYDPEAAGASPDDIAILELQWYLRFNETFMPVCMSKREFDETEDIDNLVAAGWGKQNSGVLGFWNLQESECLRHAELDLVNDTECLSQYSSELNIRKTICAGGNTNICDGDSGGPLMTRRDGYVFQVGITSFGTPDCGFVSGTPSGFERLSVHMKWIRKTTRRGICFK
jgi:secreted trypsin-like serine protease